MENIIYVDIDAILDTRLSTISLLGMKALQTTFDNDYFNRIDDLFAYLGKGTFSELYKKRNRRTLYNAIGTNIRKYILEYLEIANNQNLNSPIKADVVLEINYYPYNLTNTEIGHFESFFKQHFTNTNVRMVYKRYEDIDPKYVADNISIMIMYEYYKWLDIHSESLKKVTCLSTVLVAPQLYFRDLTEDDIKLIKKNELDPFQQTVEVLKAAGIIQLVFLPADEFSTIVQIKKK